MKPENTSPAPAAPPCSLAGLLLLAFHCSATAAALEVERVTTMTPFPRGLAFVGDEMYVLCRGRVRGSGGVSAAVDDQAGTLYVVDPQVGEPIDGEVGEAVRVNGRLLALPTDPPFRLWDRTATPPEADRRTDRPYCTLRYHGPTHSLYLCAFSGIDKKASKEDPVAFSKNDTDAVLRYDLRTKKWYEVERHSPDAGDRYPHHDPADNAPPHGWLNGPDNCLAVGNWLYVASKDNSLLVRYDLSALVHDPEAGYPPSELVMGERVEVEGQGAVSYQGQSALAFRDGWLYIGYRTSSVILRIRLGEDHLPVQPVRAQLLARFDPYDPVTRKSADLTDLDLDDKGRVYVVSASPARVYRFTPDPEQVFDAIGGKSLPWADLATITSNPKMKSENVSIHKGWAYVTSGDGYSYQKDADGTVYRVRIAD